MCEEFNTKKSWDPSQAWIQLCLSPAMWLSASYLIFLSLLPYKQKEGILVFAYRVVASNDLLVLFFPSLLYCFNKKLSNGRDQNLL